MIVASTVPVPPIWMTRAILMRLFSSVVTGWTSLPNCTIISMLTFWFVTPCWTDPADASDATLTAASNAANARRSLPHFIALPHCLSDDSEVAPGSVAILDNSRRVERTELGQETAGRLAGLADKRKIVHAHLPDRCRRRPAELQDSGRVFRAVLSDGRAGATAYHEHARHVELAVLVQHDRRAAERNDGLDVGGLRTGRSGAHATQGEKCATGGA